MDIPVFFIEPVGRNRIYLRRYASGSTCHGKYGYHDAMAFICEEVDEGRASGDTHDHADPRWPAKCDYCDYQFTAEDHWQRFSRRIYKRADTGEETTLSEAPVGACWDADWIAEGRTGFYVGDDGRCLVVRTPGGEWMIDARASNCTMPDDNKHKCWVRHGKPEDGTLHVDKNGLTCAAGAGSIVIKDYHGFLHNGKLTNC